jgi:hypothetical protein
VVSLDGLAVTPAAGSVANLHERKRTKKSVQQKGKDRLARPRDGGGSADKR